MPPPADVPKPKPSKEDAARNAMMALMGGAKAATTADTAPPPEVTTAPLMTRQIEIQQGEARHVLWDLNSCLELISRILTDLYIASTADHSVAVLSEKEVMHMERVTDHRLWDEETRGAHAATGLRATRQDEMNMTLSGGVH